MKVTPINFFEPLDDMEGSVSQAGYEVIENIENYKKCPVFVTCENEYYDDEIVVANTHEFKDPRNYKTVYASDVELLGIWNITYKNASNHEKTIS